MVKPVLRYFSDSEILRVTHSNGVTLDNLFDFYDPILFVMLDDLRRRAKVPVLLRSGFRDSEYNAKVGGVKDSSHCKGLAMDISCSDSSHRLLYLRSALAAGFRRIGIGKDFLHLDIDSDKPQDVIWLY